MSPRGEKLGNSDQLIESFISEKRGGYYRCKDMVTGIRIKGYGEYSGSNYGVNALKVEIDGVIAVYFSYDTPVAFSTGETGLVVRKNDWSTTTGKHLNWIDGGDKSSRISGADFEAKLGDILKRLNIAVPQVG